MIGLKTLVLGLETEIKKNNFTKSVSKGSIFNVALNKRDIYPIAHIVTDTFRESGEALVYTVSVVFMDLTTDELDVKHEQSALALSLSKELKKGNLWNNLFQLNNEPSFELFNDRFDDDVCGCTINFEVWIKNDIE